MRASLDADAVVALQVREAQALRQSLVEEGCEAALRTGDVEHPIPALLEVKDRHGNRIDLRIGLRGMDPELMNRTRQARLAETILEIVGREDFIAIKAFAGGDAEQFGLPGSVARPRRQRIRSERPRLGRVAFYAAEHRVARRFCA